MRASLCSAAPQPFNLDQFDASVFIQSHQPVAVHLLTASIGDLKYSLSADGRQTGGHVRRQAHQASG